MRTALSSIMLATLLAGAGCANLDQVGPTAGPRDGLAKFEPDSQQVLVFVGQDNASVGGTAAHRNGYVDQVGVPAGITHYVYFAEGQSNSFGYTFDVGTVDGLGSKTTWGAGPMCLRCYLESPTLKDLAVHLSISMEFGAEDQVAAGNYDHLIDELAMFLNEFRQFPFYLRIGYEFDGSWNDYDPPNFRRAWRRIVDGLRAAQVSNFATVLGASRGHIERATWEAYWPGDDYVDWLGYSYWYYDLADYVVLDIAREKNLPVMLAEVTPRGLWLDQVGAMAWFDYYQNLFAHIEQNGDVIKGLAYINANWDVQPMWHGRGWGNTQIQDNPELKQRWLAKMAEPRYLHGSAGVYRAIGFR